MQQIINNKLPFFTADNIILKCIFFLYLRLMSLHILACRYSLDHRRSSRQDMIESKICVMSNSANQTVLLS